MAHQVNYEVRWKNFRGFRDTGWISLPPLTILLGVNNAGKTSFTAPLLLMAQTVEASDAASAIVSRGNLVDVGHFDDLLHGGAQRKDVFLGFRFHVHDPETGLKKIGAYPPGAIEFSLQPDPAVPSGIGLKHYSIFDLFRRQFLTLRRTKAGNYRLSGFNQARMRPSEVRALRGYRPFNFLFSPTRLTRSLGQLGKQQPDMAALRGRYSREFSQLLTVIGYTYTEVRDFLARMSYLGPLREKPRRYYEAPGYRPGSIGSRGEYAPYVLRNRASALKARVDYWVSKFGLGDRVQVDDHFEDIFSIKLAGHPYRKPRNIADVGFGVSQVFPLIVQSVSAGNNSLTIAEQPEIHLNPKLQCLLADLFVDMANRKRRVIVETHSEHFLLRLRSLIADEKIKLEDVAVYFIEKIGRDSTIRRVKLDELGHIADKEWPDGFFADTLKESLGLAQAQARAKQRHQRGS